MLSDTSAKALEEATYMSRKPNCPNFLFGFAVLIFVMIMAAVSYLAYPRLRSMIVDNLNKVLICTHARVLYDRCYKTLRAVLKSVPNLLSPKSNQSGGKSRHKDRGKGKSRGRGKRRSKAKQKDAAPPQLKGYRSLLVLMVITGVFCVLGSGEALWFSHINDSKATEGVNEVLDDGVVERVRIEVC